MHGNMSLMRVFNVVRIALYVDSLRILVPSYMVDNSDNGIGENNDLTRRECTIHNLALVPSPATTFRSPS